MPQLGDTIKAGELGYKGNPSAKYVWSACIECNEPRWIRFENGKPKAERCIKCNAHFYGRNHSGEKSGRWHGGRYVRPDGYVLRRIAKEDFFYPMVTKEGQASEHRLVMARSLGRCLASWEQVHHKNGIRDDNRIENLELATQGVHHLEHSKGYRDGYTKGLADGRTKQIKELQVEIVRLNTLILRKAVNREV